MLVLLPFLIKVEVIMERKKKYYYSHFLTDRERKICDLIIDGLENRKKSIVLPGMNSSNASIFKVLEVIDLDFPEYFFLNIAATKIWSMGLTKKIDIGYLYSIDEITVIEKQINQKCQTIINAMSQESSLLNKEKILHNYLIKNTHYAVGDLSNPRLHNIVGALVDGIAVCEGYAKAFHYICDKHDILCMVVTGIATNAFDGVRGSHAWNIVRVHEKGCCHVDVTWDSCFYHSGSSHYVFFNQTDQDMMADHSWDRGKVPKCGVAVEEVITYCESVKQFEDAICSNIKGGRLIFNLKVKKIFSGNEEVLATTQKIIRKHPELMVKQYTVSYIAARRQIEYQFEKF